MKQRLTLPGLAPESPVRFKAPCCIPTRLRGEGHRRSPEPGCSLNPENFSSQPAGRSRTAYPPPQKMPDIRELCRRDKLHCELSPPGAFLSEGGADGAKPTSAVLPPSPAPGQVSKRRNGDTARTVPRCRSTGSPLTHKLPSTAKRARHGAGPFPSSRERKKICLQLLRSSRPSLYLGGLRSRRRRACAHRTSRNACVSIRDARSDWTAALRAPGRRAGAARGIIRESPTSAGGCRHPGPAPRSS